MCEGNRCLGCRQLTWLAPSASVTDSTVGMAIGIPPTMITSKLVRVGHSPAHKEVWTLHLLYPMAD
jgi:hypothetical protein